MTANPLASDMTATATETPGWRAESECRKHPTRWWFAGGHRETIQAKEVCADCPVQGPCLEFALSRADLLGIWAGTTPNERTAVRRGRRPRVAGSEASSVHASEPDPFEPDPFLIDDAPLVIEMAPRPNEVHIDLVAEAEAAALRPIDREAKRRSAQRPGRGVGPEAVFVERNDLLTPAEAAHKLGVTPNTVTRWSRAGKISAIQTMGGHRRFRRSEIERVIQAANVETSLPI